MSRRNNTPERLLELFRQRMEWTGEELSAEIGWRFGSSIHLLRKKGVNILTIPRGGNNFSYRLMYDPNTRPNV